MNTLTITKKINLSFETAEALNQFRMNLGFCGNNVRKIMVTSSLPGEGKSFISYHLWEMLAELGSSVLLIDCDLRKSAMKTELGLAGDNLTYGIEHYLLGQVNMDEVIYATDVNNGYMIPALSSVINPTVLLESDYFSKLMSEAGRKFDYVILDTAPVGSVADALNNAGYCDGTVLVVRSNDTPRKYITHTLELLKRTSTPLLGIVLNRMDTSSRTSSYYRYYNRKGYDHYYGNGHTKKGGKKA